MIGDDIANELAGNKIKLIFNKAEEIAELHGCLTSPRGENFKLRLLQALEVPLKEKEIERLRIESGINEYHRHLNRLVKNRLVRVLGTDGKEEYRRTELGERAINALRGFERKVGSEAAETVYSAALGPNSIRFFLRIYGDKKEADLDNFQIKYTAAEIGRLSLFLPRTIEGISAIDKLNEADLLAYWDDNFIHMQTTKAVSYYLYLQELYAIIETHAASQPIDLGIVRKV